MLSPVMLGKHFCLCAFSKRGFLFFFFFIGLSEPKGKSQLCVNKGAFQDACGRLELGTRKSTFGPCGVKYNVIPWIKSFAASVGLI